MSGENFFPVYSIDGTTFDNASKIINAPKDENVLYDIKCKTCKGTFQSREPKSKPECRSCIDTREDINDQERDKTCKRCGLVKEFSAFVSKGNKNCVNCTECRDILNPKDADGVPLKNKKTPCACGKHPDKYDCPTYQKSLLNHLLL